MKYVIISTCYNKDHWVQKNVNSLKAQSNQNFVVGYGYDTSTDKTLEYLKSAIGEDSDKYLIIPNKGVKCFLGNFVHTYNAMKERGLVDPEDVIVEIDGDDWLYDSFVLDRLDKVYSNKNTWMTYGQYVKYPTGEFGGHIHMHLNNSVDATNTYRQHPFAYSHLRTYKSWLLNMLSDADLKDPNTGEYFKAAGDFALCFPMVEIAGKSHIHRFAEPMYVLNRHDELENETKLRLDIQKHTDQAIRLLPTRDRIHKTPSNVDTNITTVIGTCDAYSPLWKNFDILYNRYWGLNTRNILISETQTTMEDIPHSDYDIIAQGSGMKWGERMLKALEVVQTPYVFFILEDYYLTEPLTKDYIMDHINLMEKYKADKLLFDTPYPKYHLTKLSEDSLYQFNISSEYLNSVQPGLWRTEYLKKVLKPEYSPWDFEVAGNAYTASQRPTILLKQLEKRFYHNFIRRGGVITEGWENLYIKEGLK